MPISIGLLRLLLVTRMFFSREKANEPVWSFFHDDISDPENSRVIRLSLRPFRIRRIFPVRLLSGEKRMGEYLKTGRLNPPDFCGRIDG
jgi:hypothetical protein